MRFAVWVPLFDELAVPLTVARLATLRLADVRAVIDAGPAR